MESQVQQQIELLRRQYFQVVEPSQLLLPPKVVLKRSDVQSSIYNSLFHESVIYSPSERYKLRVLKLLVDAMTQAVDEPEEDEISDDIVACLAELVAQPRIPELMSVQQKKYVTYTAPVDGPNAPSITLLESQAVLASSGTTGLRTWEAALCLGAFLCSTKGMRFVDGKRLIELGAGTGFVSLLCAKHLGAECVLATDGSTEVVDALASNVYVNHLDKSNKITARILKWGHDTVKDTLNEDSTSGSYELILGADVTYDQQSIMSLVSTLDDIFSLNMQAQALISATIRNQDTFNVFLDTCSLRKFGIQLIHCCRNEDPKMQLGFFHDRSVEIQIYRISPRPTRLKTIE